MRVGKYEVIREAVKSERYGPFTDIRRESVVWDYCRESYPSLRRERFGELAVILARRSVKLVRHRCLHCSSGKYSRSFFRSFCI